MPASRLPFRSTLLAATTLIGALLLAACTPPEKITPVTTMPADTRGDIAVAAVLPEFAEGVINQDKLADELRKEITSYVSRCNATATTPHDIRVRVTKFERGSAAQAYTVGGAKSTLDATVEIVPAGGGEPVGVYDFSVAVASAVKVGASEWSLSQRLGAYLCMEMLGKPNPGGG